jgi:hypothetical protein
LRCRICLPVFSSCRSPGGRPGRSAWAWRYRAQIAGPWPQRQDHGC